MIERMKFLNITGPKDDIDRVIETYISKYDFQIENALSELKDVKELHPFTDTNPYKNVLSISQELKEYFKNVDFKSNRQMSIEEAEELTKTLYDKVNAFSQNYRRLNIQAIERDIEMLIAKERAEGLSEQERQVLVKLITSKEMQKKQLVNPQ